jgi:hypothetical protein
MSPETQEAQPRLRDEIALGAGLGILTDRACCELRDGRSSSDVEARLVSGEPYEIAGHKIPAGVSASAAEKIVAAAKKQIEAAEDVGAILTDLIAYVRRFVVLTDDQYVAVALWVLHTYAIEAAHQAPYLNIRSPEKQSGKTRLMEVLEKLCRNPWLTQRPSEAVFFRKIDMVRPTLLLDETDAIWNAKGEDHEGLRSALNAGNRRGVTVDRVGLGKKLKLESFSTFCPKALAGIGELPDTIADRAVPIVLKRKTKGETVERFRQRKPNVTEPAAKLRQRMLQWGADHEDELADAEPDGIPETLSDRAHDSIEILVAIADAAGGEWPQRSRDALERIITAAAEETGAESLRLRALADCKAVFASRGDPDRVRTSELVAALRAIEDGPWGDEDRRLTPQRLAWYLSPYGIKPKNIKFDDGAVAKGYETAAFAEAWERYLSPQTEADALAARGGGGLHVD